MKTRVVVGACLVLLTAGAAASAGEQGASSGPSADETAPTSIACAQEAGEALGECSYSVERGEKGRTTLTVIFENGFKRRLFFEGGRFVKASVTMSGVGTDTEWRLEDGIHVIRVDGQRYDVPDVLIAGD